MEDEIESPEADGYPAGQGASLQDPSIVQLPLGKSQIYNEHGGSERGRARRKLGSLVAVAGRVVDTVRPHPFADDDKPALNEVRHDAAFNPSRVEKELNLYRDQDPAKGLIQSTTLDNVVNVVLHPKKAAKKKIKKVAASELASGQKPLVSRTGELRFLDANTGVQTSANAAPHAENTRYHGHYQSDGQILENRRDSLRAAWATSHLRRVKVVNSHAEPYPVREPVADDDPRHLKREASWAKWLGKLVLYHSQTFSAKYIDHFDELPFDIATTRTNVERVIIESGPWQAWLMDVRSVYRWEDPGRTTRWLLLYAFLWSTDRIMTFFWAYIIYHVVRNRQWQHSVKHFRAAGKRALDREATAFQIGELIDRHGSEEWIDPFMQNAGPYVQLQLGDLADLLEILSNFSAWKAPEKTMATLCFFTACLLTSLFADLTFCMRIVWFVSGSTFFLCWPISSRYPRYRLLVSPFKWVLWDIPTHAEFSFKYLRAHAQLSREKMINGKIQAKHESEVDSPPLASYAGNLDRDTSEVEVSDGESVTSTSSNESWETAASAESVLAGDDMLSFRAHWKGITGRLYLYSKGVRFVRNLPRQELWMLPYTELAEMRKAGVGGRRKLTLGGLFDSGVLQLVSTAGEVWSLDPIKHRDEAFNCIVGFSDLQWQVLRGEPGKGLKPVKAGDSAS